MSFHGMFTRGLVAALLLCLGSQVFAARTTTYLHNDGLGSVVAATNQAGAVLWRKDYAPFGEQIDSTPDSERTAYTGKQHDDAIGLTYFGGRHFDPELGRFTSVDPVAFTEQNAMSFNRYLYVNNNPYKYVDPDGEFLTYVAKFVIDVGINVALNYVTTGEANLKGALKESVIGLINPIPGKNAGKLVMAIAKAGKKAPEPSTVSSAARILNPEQAANLARFEKKLPAGAGPTKVHDLPIGGKAFQAEVPGRVPGSKAVYEKQLDANGMTTGYTKTTYAPAGDIVHVKDKITGETFP